MGLIKCQKEMRPFAKGMSGMIEGHRRQRGKNEQDD